MSIRVGFDHSTIEHRGLTPAETLEFARTHGMDGVQFLEPSVIDAGLDPERLGGFRRRAEAMGLYLEVVKPTADEEAGPTRKLSGAPPHAAGGGR